jgi:hypothetical protein
MNGYWRSIVFAGVALNLYAWGLAMSEGWVLVPGTFAAGISCAEFFARRRAERLKHSSGNQPVEHRMIERIQALELELAEHASALQQLRAERDFDRQLSEIPSDPGSPP